MVTPEQYRRRRWVGLLLLAAACSFHQAKQSARQPQRVQYDMQQLVASRSGPELEGRKLFAQRCALCHIGNQTEVPFGGWLNELRIQSIGEAKAREQILEGTPRMPAWKYTLEHFQVEQIIAYLKTVKNEKQIEPLPSRETVLER
jgi:mono/diheme cytochrome c family protein